MFFTSFVLLLFCFVVGEKTLSDYVHMWTPNTLCVCSPSSFVRVGILLLKGQALFIALKKRASFIAEIVGSFLNIVNIIRLYNLFKCV